MSLREEFVQLCRAGGIAVSVACARFGISRKTGYKWLARHAKRGQEGLADISRRPHRSPGRTPGALEAAVVALRAQHPWGGRKLRNYLLQHEAMAVPAASTITAILRRHNCIGEEQSEKRQHWIRFERERPNDLWQMDFKGHFATDAGRCHPLTVLDDHSRYCVCLDAHTNERFVDVKKSLESVFGIHGLPVQMNTDNGPPFGNMGQLTGFSQLAVWLMRLGIVITYSRPAHPQTNGKDERFHQTLKAELLQAHHFRDNTSAQEAFDFWRSVYNFHRPHEALADKPPISRYRPSPRPYPSPLPPIEYESRDHVRLVQPCGYIYFRGQSYYASEALARQRVAVRPSSQDGLWDVYFVRQRIRTINLRDKTDD